MEIQLLAFVFLLVLPASYVQAEIDSSNATLNDDTIDTELTTQAPQLVDLPIFGDFLTSLNNSGTLLKQNNWRDGLKFNEALMYMFNVSKLTDCEFIVGPNGSEETIKAHTVILAAASPAFESAFENFTSYRIPDWKPTEFRKVINFIYSGGLCFEDFEEACALLKLSSSLMLPEAKEAAHDYIYSHMFPNKLWHSYQCAKEAGDEKLAKIATQFIADFTSEAITETEFYDLSREELADFLKLDYLAVSSEVEIVDAVIRWGYKQVIRSGRKPTPQIIREALGPDVVKNIRFLTMTGPEFTKIYIGSFILDCQESLAVLLNINTPGGVGMPDTLSSNMQKRTKAEIASTGSEGETFRVPVNRKCGSEEKSIADVVDYLTTTPIKNSYAWNVHSIQIPKSIEARQNSSLKEQFKVIIIDSQNKTIDTITYDKIPPATTKRGIYSNTTKSHNIVEDNKLIKVPLGKLYSISIFEGYKIKFELQAARTYPRWIYSGDQTGVAQTRYESRENPYRYNSYRNYDYVVVAHDQSFVYSYFLSP